MMNTKCFLAIFVVACCLCARSAAQTTEFTHQGQLTVSGAVANGNFDFEFKLFDASSSGAQVGSTVQRLNVAVASGIYTVTLDFGSAPFSGADRFLDIAARTAGGGPFTPLTPRQKVTSAPYAIKSLNAASADSVAVAGIPAGSSNYIQNTTSQQAASNFNISGNGNVGGTLGANVVNAVTQYNLAGSRVLTSVDGNLFAGVGAGASTTPTTFGNAFFGLNAGKANTSACCNAFFGSVAGQNNTTTDGSQINAGSGNSFFGYTAGAQNTQGRSNSFFGSGAGLETTLGRQNTFIGAVAGATNVTGNNNTILGNFADVTTANLANATAIGANALVGTSNSLVLGGINGMNGATADTNVGIGTTAPLSRLDVRGDVFVGVSGFAASPNPVNTSNSLFIGNDSGDASVSFRLDGFQNNLFVVARSQAGATNGAGIVFRTSNTGLGEIDAVTIAPSGSVVLSHLGAGGGTPLCLNGQSAIASCSSSLRYKTNVTRFKGGLDIIKGLRPISFDWKEDHKKDIGLAAEEVEKVSPLLTFRNEKGEIEGVKYSQLSAVFINAFKQQQVQIEADKAKIDNLASEVKEQRSINQKQAAEIEALKAIVCLGHRRAASCAQRN